jgi:hypothetical protein
MLIRKGDAEMANVIQPSSANAYWYEIFKCASAYEEIGSLVLNAIPFAENDRPTALTHFFESFAGIGSQIEQLQTSVNQKLIETTLTEPSGDLFGIKASLDEFKKLGNQSILVNVVTRSNEIVARLAGFLAHDDTPADYYHVANGLLFALVSLRAAAFFLFDRSQADVNGTVCMDLRQSLGDRARGVETARTVGRNRVSEVNEELTLIDELGPVWGTIFSIRVDGRVVYDDTFGGARGIPHRNINDVRNQARQMHDSLLQSNADFVSADLKKAYDTADATSLVVC